jgi:hypothetical protein
MDSPFDHIMYRSLSMNLDKKISISPHCSPFGKQWLMLATAAAAAIAVFIFTAIALDNR